MAVTKNICICEISDEAVLGMSLLSRDKVMVLCGPRKLIIHVDDQLMCTDRYGEPASGVLFESPSACNSSDGVPLPGTAQVISPEDQRSIDGDVDFHLSQECDRKAADTSTSSDAGQMWDPSHSHRPRKQ